MSQTDETKQQSVDDRMPGWLLPIVAVIFALTGLFIGVADGRRERKYLQEDVDWYKADRDRWQQNAQEWRNADIADRYGADKIIHEYQKECR